jgi:hypothetical protein
MLEKGKILKKYMKQIYLQIHPDFFINSPNTKQQNEKTLTLLNELLQNYTKKQFSSSKHKLTYTLRTGRTFEHILDPTNFKFIKEKLGSVWTELFVDLIKKNEIEIEKEDLKLLGIKKKSFNLAPKKESFGKLLKSNLKTVDSMLKKR